MALLTLAPGTANGQNLRLRQVGSNNTSLTVQVGETVHIEVIGDLQGVASAGISFFITVPEDAFHVLDQGIPGQIDGLTHPFAPGSLFAGAQTASNVLMVEDPLHPEFSSVALTTPGQQMEYSAVIGAGADRVRTGAGVVATFSLQCIAPIEFGHIKIDDNPVFETRLFLSDGISEKRFTTVQGLEITVAGIALRNIPNVILLPGQSDHMTIGSLDDYVRNSLSPADSIRWTYEPAEIDSLTITIDPDTREVSIVPAEGWRGRQRILWRATEHKEVIPGQPPLFAVDITDIIINNPPSFSLNRGPDGVKRDTVWLLEDQHTFIPGTINPDVQHAYRGRDLDDLVIDPDIVDPDAELNYLVSRTDRVRGDDDPDTHELLLWSAPNFAGVDSVQVLVRDGLGSQDTLRVIVFVDEIPDAPRFIVEDTNPTITRGKSKRYRIDELVEDVDTPLDSLLFSWVDDPDNHFVADTLRLSGVLTVEIVGDPTFTGTAPIRFAVADPVDTLNLVDNTILYFTSSPEGPPAVFPRDIKIDLSPGGPAQIENLDEYVEDPDTDDADLTWAIPSVTRSQMGLDVNRRLSVSAPPDFVGYEGIDLTVSDPANQSDNLALRIYSSDGRPVVGGIPDVALNRGDQNQQTDLDNYYYDLDNQDGDMIWRVLETYDSSNLQVSVDYLTHLITYFAPQSAVFRTETVVFQVTDPSGTAAEDTVLVTIHSDGVDPGGDFGIAPPLPPLQAPVGQITPVLNLNDHLVTSPSIPASTIRWEVTRAGRIGAAIVSGGEVSVFSFEKSGLDTLEFAATDTLGRVKRVSTTVLYFGVTESLELRSIPDIVFIAGEQFTDLLLNDFILDRQTHPDSLIEWSYAEITSGEAPVFLQIGDDSSVFAIASDTTESEVVFVARNTDSGVTGRDTVRVISQDKTVGALDLKAFPPLLLELGEEDDSIVLNEYLPEGYIPTRTNWSVTGQTITSPVIDPISPHRLTLSSVGTRLGVDTLSFAVDMGGGFRADGDLIVTVSEVTNASTLELRVVPNPTNPVFVDFYAMARTELASSPTVVVSMGGDTTVAVRQIEDRLEHFGVLIWAGRLTLPDRTTGTVLFSAQALTALGSSVNAVAAITIGIAGPGKPVALRHGPVSLHIPAGSVLADTRVALLTGGAEGPATGKLLGSSGTSASYVESDELSQRASIDLYPLGLKLERPAVLRLVGQYEQSDGLYAHTGDGWGYLSAAADAAVELTRLGRYAIMRDGVAPQIGSSVAMSEDDAVLEAQISDGGSGVADAHLLLLLPDLRLSAQVVGDRARWALPGPIRPGQYAAEIWARDRAGNEARRAVEVRVPAGGLPSVLQLHPNYPNPFNPETAIPFSIPGAGGQDRFGITIYNATGQTVRRLLDDVLEAGQHEVVWDGRDDGGQAVGSGVYLYRLEGAGSTLIRQMALVR